MNLGKFVFAQVMEHLPLHAFHRCVVRYSGEHKVKRFSCLDQYLCMAFAQLTYRESLRDIEACLRVQSSKLYHLGFRSPVARNTLANTNSRCSRPMCGVAAGLSLPSKHLIRLAFIMQSSPHNVGHHESRFPSLGIMRPVRESSGSL